MPVHGAATVILDLGTVSREVSHQVRDVAGQGRHVDRGLAVVAAADIPLSS